jgi:hypothetical protein
MTTHAMMKDINGMVTMYDIEEGEMSAWTHNKDCRRTLYPEYNPPCSCGASEIHALKLRIAEENAGWILHLTAELNNAYERAAQVCESLWDNDLSGAHGGEQANRTAKAIRALKTK